MTSLLERHDDPDHWEYQRDFDWQTESRDFAAFVRDLEARLGRRFDVETGSRIQDASFHSQILLPGGLLRFSDFGRMIAVTPDSEVPEDVMAAIRELAAGRGYTLVPTADLEAPYPRADGTRLGIRTWWIRFFDYL